MPDFYSVVIQEDWIPPLKPYLDKMIEVETEEKGIARQCLEELETIKFTMEVMKATWAQGSFTTKQMHLLKDVSGFLQMEEAERRFSI